MTGQEIKKALMRRELTLSDVARRGGWTYAHVYQVAYLGRASAPVRDALAEATGLPVTKLFGAKKARPVGRPRKVA